MTSQHNSSEQLVVAHPFMNVLRRSLVAKLKTLGVTASDEKVQFHMDTAPAGEAGHPHFLFTLSVDPDVLLLTRNTNARTKGADMFKQLAAHLSARLGGACHVTTAHHLPNGVSFMVRLPVPEQDIQQAFGDFFESEKLQTTPFLAHQKIAPQASGKANSWALRAEASRDDSAIVGVVR